MKNMNFTVRVRGGTIEVRTTYRRDQRWDGEYRFIPSLGEPTDWRSATLPEGFVGPGIALSAAIMAGHSFVDNLALDKRPTV